MAGWCCSRAGAAGVAGGRQLSLREKNLCFSAQVEKLESFLLM